MAGGNTQGIKQHILDGLDELIGKTSQSFLDDEIAEELAYVSTLINREIALVLVSNGRILDITFGSHDKVNPALQYGRNISQKGLVIIHTHPNASAQLSAADLSMVSESGGIVRAVASMGTDAEGHITGVEAAFYNGGAVERLHGAKLSEDAFGFTLSSSKGSPNITVTETGDRAERTVLAAAVMGADLEDLEYNMSELRELARTAGAEVVGELTQRKDKPDKAFLLGKGKLQELAILLQNTGADTVIFDNELSGIQVNNLQRALNVKVIDRSNLILDIFAARASSMEGKLQVELAQLKYSLPRLIGYGGTMDKMRSGIGMRGPGEKKLETDRRIIRKSVSDLEKRIDKLAQERDVRRKQRSKSTAPTVALVGYTNAGKSTLLNALSRSDVLAENMLFATLDPVTRKVFAGEGKFFYLTDTVGFINKLPHQFIDAFASTLEEAAQADLLLHVMDVSGVYLSSHYQVVCQVLERIGAGAKPVIYVYNKSDLAEGKELDLPISKDSIIISARNPDDINVLKDKIIESLFGSGENAENKDIQ